MARPSVVTKRPMKTRVVPELSTNAPFLGLNTKDDISDMDPRYALSLVNFVCTPTAVSCRQGYRTWATGLPGDVTALMPFQGPNANNNKLFAASVSGFYDVTIGGAVGAAVVGGLNSSSPYWQYAQQAGAGVSFLMCVNGIDAPRLYNGTTWTTTSTSGSPGFGQFGTNDTAGNAVTITNFADVTLHQKRLWYVQNNSTKAYYTPVDSPTGTLAPFDFGSQFPRGGSLWKLVSWSVNMGAVAGIQSNLFAISTKGDVAVYVGTDPATASTWGLSAVYQLGAPTGRRCTQQFESELLYLSRDGVYPLSKYLQTGTSDTSIALTDKIAPTVSDLIETYATTPGFEMCLYPGKNMLVLNVPQGSTANNIQFVMNTVTNAWSQFIGWGASTFGMFNEAMYFGTTGKVNLAFIGYQDGADIDGAGGTNIICTGLTAFGYFERPGQIKHVHQVKPYIVTGVTNPLIFVGVNTDFNLIPIIGSATVNPVTGAVWDNAKWDDLSSTWVGSLTTYNQWTTPLCYPGDALAFAISISAAAETRWTRTGWIIEPGGVWG